MARVKELAPCWSGTAVLDGDFEDLSSEQYKGIWASAIYKERANSSEQKEAGHVVHARDGLVKSLANGET